MTDANSQALVWSILFGGGETEPTPEDWNSAGEYLDNREK